jgi:two-component system response regulator DegU
MSFTSPDAAVFRVFVIEPQVLLSLAICAALAEDPHLNTIGSARSLDDAKFTDSHPDFVLLDVDDDIAHLEALVERCRNIAPGVRTCIMSAHLSTDLMLRAIAAGADGYVVKDTSPVELARSIRTIAQHGFHVDPRLAGELLRARATGSRSGSDELSPREISVVRLIAEGLSNKEIGERLLLSDKTIKNHVSSIFAKMQVTARTQVVIRAIRTGLV